MHFLTSWLRKCTHSSHYCSFLHFIKKLDRPFHNNLLAQSQFLLITVINLSVFPSSEVWSEMKGEKRREKNGESGSLGDQGPVGVVGPGGLVGSTSKADPGGGTASGTEDPGPDHGMMLRAFIQGQRKCKDSMWPVHTPQGQSPPRAGCHPPASAPAPLCLAHST